MAMSSANPSTIIVLQSTSFKVCLITAYILDKTLGIIKPSTLDTGMGLYSYLFIS